MIKNVCCEKRITEIVKRAKRADEEVTHIVGVEGAAVDKQKYIAEAGRKSEELRAFAHKGNIWLFPNPIKKLIFQNLCGKLTVYAEQRAADLVIEKMENRATVRMVIGQMILDGLYPVWHNRLWNQMMKYADNVCLEPVQKRGKPAIQCTFVFDCMWELRNDWNNRLLMLDDCRIGEYD